MPLNHTSGIHFFGVLHFIMNATVHGRSCHGYVFVDKSESVLGPVRLNSVTIPNLRDSVVSFLGCHSNERGRTCSLLAPSPWGNLSDTHLKFVS